VDILFVTAEVAPFAKTGGLGDVSGALPPYLAARGHDIRVFLPLYQRAHAPGRTFTPVERLRALEIRLGDKRYEVSVFTSPLRGASGLELPVYFVHCPALYDRPGIYTRDGDEHLRFLVLSRAALESCRRMGWAPQIVHCNDWHTSLIPLTLRAGYAGDPILGRARTLLSIHNLNHQGRFGTDILRDTGLSSVAHLFHQDQLREGMINFLLHGILYADGICAVSPTYAREIQTDEYGVGLQGILRQRSSTVVGILNGVDYNEWNPETDKHIKDHFSPTDLGPKQANKRALVEGMGLPYDPDVPVIGIVSRLAAQKGFDLLFDSMPGILHRRDCRFIVLGSGEGRFEDFFRSLQGHFRHKVCFWHGFNNQLAHLIEAGSDMFLMPSRYEPCGLNQMYSLKYGTVPIVRKTGGLADTVIPWNPNTQSGTGFVFEHYTTEGVRWAVEAALDAYQDKQAWHRLMQNGMAQDYSWETQIKKYELLYSRLLGQ
jgi:starch synthase